MGQTIATRPALTSPGAADRLGTHGDHTDAPGIDRVGADSAPSSMRASAQASMDW
ncbi:hypothetical protein ACQP1S_12135 [Micromonospora matsumotoense]|uniref:hypothetical protein n=1 Tax=Micromonospora matsumotoense TaxID=121616 RepID=UPI003D8C65E0